MMVDLSGDSIMKLGLRQRKRKGFSMNVQIRKPRVYLVMALMAVILLPQIASADTIVNRHNPFRQNVVAANADQSSSSAAVARANELSNAFRSASSRVLPALVAIETRADASTAEAMNDRNPFHRQMPEFAMGLGSGVIVDPSGIISGDVSRFLVLKSTS